jgi:hypothetical protein
MLRRIFGSERDRYNKRLEKLFKEEVHRLHASLNTIRAIKIKDKMGKAYST